jgi:hypothetical protein
LAKDDTKKKWIGLALSAAAIGVLIYLFKRKKKAD